MFRLFSLDFICRVFRAEISAAYGPRLSQFLSYSMDLAPSDGMRSFWSGKLQSEFVRTHSIPAAKQQL